MTRVDIALKTDDRKPTAFFALANSKTKKASDLCEAVVFEHASDRLVGSFDQCSFDYLRDALVVRRRLCN